MHPTCKQCGNSFHVTDDDLAFYEKVSPVFAGKKQLIPPPTLCPDCRQQRRLSFRNERSLHHRLCDFSHQNMVSMYSAEAPFPVYETSIWWSDKWDPLDYGITYDANKPFFPQITKLLRNVPSLSLMVRNCENCTYNNEVWKAKDCYMCSTTGEAQNMYYCYWTGWGSDCIDCTFSFQNELCYHCLDSRRCYNSAFIIQSENIHDSQFLFDCQGCNHCFCCSGLRNKEYWWNNEALSREEYAKRMKQNSLGSHKTYRAWKECFEILKSRTPRRNVFMQQSENCTGDFIRESADCHHCFDIIGGQQLKYFTDGGLGNDCMDVTQCAPVGPLVYETQSGENMSNLLFSNFSWDCHDAAYCNHCFNCKNCFACVGLRHKNYCILNKQFSEEDYGTLVPKIIEHMRKTGEWGEFFPISMSPFAYNETVAQEYFPLTKEEVLARGWKWRDQTDEMPKVDRVISAAQLPDSIDDVPDDILNRAIECEVTKRPFKIIKQELAFYRQMRLPVPRLHPDERHRRRMALRNPRKLWNRECAKCQQSIATSYAPDRPETVYCESCYLKEVY